MATKKTRTVERIQTGVRMEKRIFGVLKAVADLHGISLGDLLEGLALHAFDGKVPFSPETRKKKSEKVSAWLPATQRPTGKMMVHMMAKKLAQKM